MRFFSALALLLFLFPSFSECAFSERAEKIEEVHVEAEVLEYEREKGIIVATGNVKLESKDRIFSASKVIFNEVTKEIFAYGNVYLRDGEDSIICERLYFDLEKKEGYIENGRIYIKRGNYHIEGDSIEKRGENRYCLKKASLTTCDPERPDWKFTAKNADIVVGGYARLRGAQFRIRNMPIFYLPWGIFPVKTERETGFLIPELRISSKDGIIFSPSFFWAIDKDKDATFYLSYIEERGLKPGVEFNYAIRNDKRGEWFFYIIDDRKYKHGRYELKGEHVETFARDLTLKVRGRFVSDIDYLKDFGEESEERSEALLKSLAYLEKRFKNAYFTGEVSYFRDLRQKNNDFTYKYLPFLSLFTDRLSILRNMFLFNINSEIVNFYRERGSKHARLNFEPSISKSYSSHGFNLKITGSPNIKLYLTEKDGEQTKTFRSVETLKLESSFNTHLKRRYSLGFQEGGLHSIIKPQITWTFLPKISLTNVPYIDPSDRLFETNILTYSLGHYLTTRGESPKELSIFEVEQSFSLTRTLEPSTLYEGSGRRFSDVKARLKLSLIKNLGFSNQSVINIYGDGLRAMINEFAYNPKEHTGISISHTYTKDLSHEISFGMMARYRDFYGKYGVRYSFFNHEWMDTSYEIKYSPLCWALTLKLTQTKRPKDTSFKINFDLKGITERAK
ncbi:MAG: LPS assembly protein LptD [Desulfobacterota bacterium]|nr:LPS assembly protein LptD [Thermodesulfobacteriota bacterium]MDW8001800.1 LPS assembly protein LptD [Deltaproteobacteria bacterium]